MILFSQEGQKLGCGITQGFLAFPFSDLAFFEACRSNVHIPLVFRTIIHTIKSMQDIMTEKPSEAFRNNVRVLMRRQGLTMEELGSRAGTSRPAISRILSGHDGVTIDRADRIAKALGFSLGVLLLENFEILANSH